MIGQTVKVSQKVFEALEIAKAKIEEQLDRDIEGYFDLYRDEREEMIFNEMVEQYASDVGFHHFHENESVKSIHDLTLRQFVRALDYGYEIDRTPEEQVAAYFHMMGRTQDEIEAAAENDDDIAPTLSEAQTVILAVLGMLAIEVEGVNK
ncbi:MAG: hypothetical protein RR595_13795 [Lysinibacillus sp.]